MPILSPGQLWQRVEESRRRPFHLGALGVCRLIRRRRQRFRRKAQALQANPWLSEPEQECLVAGGVLQALSIRRVKELIA